MEVLTSKNRMSATMFLSLYFSKNVTITLFLMVWQLRNIQKILLSLTVLHQVLFCFVHFCWLCISKTVFFRHFHALGTVYILFLFMLHTFSTHFMDYILYGKNLSSYSPRTSIFNNPRLANHWSRYHHCLMNSSPK